MTLSAAHLALFQTFTYAQSETRVDSPIDDALKARAGGCQDLAHIMIALARASASHAGTSAGTWPQLRTSG